MTVRKNNVFEWLKENSSGFRTAIELAQKRWGKQIIHENLMIARVKDLSLKVQIQKSFADPESLVSLPNDHIAFPCDQLLAFRVNDKFLHVMSGEIKEPRVTVQPNFEVHVESELYPVRTLSQLTKFAYVVAKDRTSILVIGQYISQIEKLARELGLPIIMGKTREDEREKLYEEFRQGRILRPKERASHFYTLVSKRTVEQSFGSNRQLFLVEQGYRYQIRYF